MIIIYAGRVWQGLCQQKFKTFLKNTFYVVKGFFFPIKLGDLEKIFSQA